MSYNSGQVSSTVLPFGRKASYQPLVLCLVTAAAGVFFDDAQDLKVWVYLVIVLSFSALWLALTAFIGLSQKNSSGRHYLAAICLYIALAATFALWHHIRWNWVGANDISRFAEAESVPICLDAVVLTEPKWLTPNDSNDGMNYRPGKVRTRLGIRAQSLRDGNQDQVVSGNLDLVIQGRVTHLQSGDRIRIYGKLVSVAPPTNPGQFNFQKYYRAQGKLVVLHVYFPESVQILDRRRLSVLAPLALLRYELNEQVWKYLNPDEAAFASAIMLGNREQLSAERRESFLRTGTSHLLAISGLHVGILAGVFWLLFRIGLLSRKSALLATIIFVVFYAWLVEFRPPALRAAVLIVTFCSGRLLGKPGFNFNLLSLAGLVILLLNPRDLFNLGAQLSFLAVATLSFAAGWIRWRPPPDPLESLIATKRNWSMRLIFWSAVKIRIAFLVSAWIWCVSMPLVAFHFNLVAPIALLVNPLLLIPLSLGLYCGLGVMALGWLFSPLAFLLGRGCQWNLSLVETIIRLAEEVPHGCSATAGPPFFAVLIFYVGVFLFAIFPPTRIRLRWLATLAVIWYFSCWVLPDAMHRWRAQQSQKLTCTFVDVDHGSAVLLQMPGGKTILYDAGSFGSSVFGYRSISGVLWSERIESIDTLIVSHADLDHYNAIPELTNRFRVGEVLMTRRTLTSGSPSVQSLIAHLRQKQIPVRLVAADPPGQSDPENSIHRDIHILSPPRAGTGGSDNSDSLVLTVDSQGYRILLTGDLEGPGLQQLLSRPPVHCDLVMAPHHGSFNSDPTEFMNWCQPATIIISGESSRIRQSAVNIFSRHNRSVYRTDQHGAIRISIDQKEKMIQTWDGKKWLRQQKGWRH